MVDASGGILSGLWWVFRGKLPAEDLKDDGGGKDWSRPQWGNSGYTAVTKKKVPGGWELYDTINGTTEFRTDEQWNAAAGGGGDPEDDERGEDDYGQDTRPYRWGGY